MNPISSTNFKYAIGNLPIKVSRDDDMLFSFRNQVVSNRSAKDNELDQLPESINSKHGQITYMLANLENNVSQFFTNFKMDIDELEDLENCLNSSRNDSSTRVNARDGISSQDEDLEDTDENSLVTLLDIDDKSDIEDEKYDENRAPNKQHTKSKYSFDKSESDKPHEASLNFTTIDPVKISKSSTTPKSRSKRIKPQLLMSKNPSGQRNRTNLKGSNTFTKATGTTERKVRKTLSGDKESKKRTRKFSKKSISSKHLAGDNNSNKQNPKSVSANRPYLKKSKILHTSKGSNSCRLEVSSKSHNSRKVKQISFYPAPQSLRIKREEVARLDDPKNLKNLGQKQVMEDLSQQYSDGSKLKRPGFNPDGMAISNLKNMQN